MSETPPHTVLETVLPDAASAEETLEFQRGLQLIAQLIAHQTHTPTNPIAVQSVLESTS
ncbi:hypothetical protein ACLPHM_13710 [Paenalcaligenes sp. Me131]|uniref:hypothetical protein n=1 Tax=Paenalcaligenes sp. Me131 TaxID=3392636 RepID=UPI003D2B724B